MRLHRSPEGYNSLWERGGAEKQVCRSEGERDPVLQNLRQHLRAVQETTRWFFGSFRSR